MSEAQVRESKRDWSGCYRDSVLAFRRCMRPGWDHLAVVLHTSGGEYVTHIYNACDKGLAHGHYFNPKWEEEALKKAFEDFEERCQQYSKLA